MKELRKKLHEIHKVNDLLNPDRSWVVENKRRLMMQIENTVTEKSSSSTLSSIKQFAKTFIPAPLLAYARPAFTGLMVLMVALAGWGASVSASFNSLPGDMLWNVKVAAEKTQIALSTNKEVKMKKQLEYAERRVEEVQTVLSSDEKRTPKRLSAARVELEKVTESVKDTVANANKTVRESVKANPNKAVELAFAIGSKTDEIAADINQLKDAAERTGDKELVKQVADAANKTDESAYVPVQSVLEAGQNPDVVQNEKVQQEIKQLVSEKLNGVLEDTQKVRSKVEQTSGTITTTPAVSVPATTSTSATNTTGTSDRSDAGSSTSSVNTGVSSSSTPPVVVSKEVAQEVTEKTRVVEESVGEVRTLIDEGKFDEALEKIKGLNQINNQAELLLRNDVPVSIPVPASSTGQATTTGAASVEQSSTTENVGSPS